MIDSGMSESERGGKITVSDFTATVFTAILQYLYKNTVLLSPQHIVELFIAASRYRMVGLCQMCEAFISQNLTIEIVLPVFQVACFYESKILKQSCLEFIQSKEFSLIEAREEYKDLPPELKTEVDTCKPQGKQYKNYSKFQVKLMTDDEYYNEFYDENEEYDEEYEGEYDEEYEGEYDGEYDEEYDDSDEEDYTVAHSSRDEKQRKLRLFREAVIKARQQSSLSQAELGFLINESESLISKIETGSLVPTLATTKKLETVTKQKLVHFLKP